MIHFTPEDISMMVGFVGILLGIYGNFKGSVVAQEKRMVVIEKDIENMRDFRLTAVRRLDNHDEQNKSLLILAEQVKALSEDMKELKALIRGNTMKINWNVRLKNKNFWLALVPALALLFQAFADIFGIKLEFGQTIDKVLVFINVLFAFLVLVGIVNDPTTTGLSDSTRALGYEEPNQD